MTAPASSSRSPTASCGPVVGLRTLPPAGHYAVGHRVPAHATPTAATRPRRRSRTSWPRRASPSLGWRDVPVDADLSRRDGPRRRCRVVPAARSVTPTRRGAAGIELDRLAVRRSQADRARARRRRAGRLLPVAVGAHARLQGHAHHAASSAAFYPDLGRRARRVARWRSCTAASPPTRSRRGRWPTRTGSSPTTARSTRCRATATGCGPARRCCQRPAPRRPRAGCSRSARPGASDSASFDEVLELLHLGGRTLPHAVLMMIPEAWENHDHDGPGQAGLLPLPRLADGAVGRPGLASPSPTAPSSAPCSTATACAPAATGSPTTTWWSWRPRSACIDIDPATGRAQGPPPAGPHVPRRHRRRAASSTTTRSRRRSPPSTRTSEWLARRPRRARRPARARARRVTATTACCAASRSSATPTRSSRSSSRRWPAPAPSRSARWAPTRPIAVLSDRPRLLFDYFAAALRPGHQPAARRHPRGARHRRSARTVGPEAQPARARRRRAAASWRCRSRSSTTTSWPRSSTSTTTATLPGFTARHRAAGCTASPAAGWRCGGRSTAIRTEVVHGHRRRGPHHRALGPQRRRGRRADPVAAAHRGRAPPPRSARSSAPRSA